MHIVVNLTDPMVR